MHPPSRAIVPHVARRRRPFATGASRPVASDLLSRNPFVILGVSETDDLPTVKMQYYALSRVHHPDMAGGSDEAFKTLSEAYHKVLDLRAGRKVEEDFEDCMANWLDVVRERNAARWQRTAALRKAEYLQLRQWYLFSEGCRDADDDQLFLRWFRLWATLNVFEVASSARIGRFAVYVERLRLSFTCGMQHAASWAHDRADGLQASRHRMRGLEMEQAERAFEEAFGVRSLLQQAYEVFESHRREESGLQEDDEDDYQSYCNVADPLAPDEPTANDCSVVTT